MNQAVRRIGRSLALVLPVVLVLSGTLAVARVPWGSPPADTRALTSATDSGSAGERPRATEGAESASPQDRLRERLLETLREQDPGVALTELQQEMRRKPSLAKHCASLATSLGRAAVEKYGAAHRAQSFARPVCDTSFASGVAQSG
ncbi:hypothetical protein [Streptomyces oceani]|uniref:Uncharacterized protein n=1 Tax=Streptomyces oceani TaxID=1075402 RepID=A0A1E7KM01_9ACTN|nr:hypothetical protein [Streptomyces oceani]OEV04975.1 hypothetical protein AN216_05055 [Streptomyces oceani]